MLNVSETYYAQNYGGKISLGLNPVHTYQYFKKYHFQTFTLRKLASPWHWLRLLSRTILSYLLAYTQLL